MTRRNEPPYASAAVGPMLDLSTPDVLYIVLRGGQWNKRVRHELEPEAAAPFASAYRDRGDAIRIASGDDIVVEYRRASGYRLVLTPEP